VKPERVIGCHVASVLPAGLVMLRPGIAMSDAQALYFELRGPGGHGASPNAGGDVIAAVAELVRLLPDVVSGMEYEGTAAVCSAGLVRAGTACNVLPAEAIVEGTLRTFTTEQRATALERLRRLCERIGSENGVSTILTLPMHAPAVTNDPAATRLVHAVAEQALGSGRVLAGRPVAPSDDVSEFLLRVPGCYFLLGAARSDGTSGMHHGPSFDIDEDAMRAGVRVLVDGATALAGESPDTPRRS